MKKIPDHAKKVFEGIMFDVFHWEQEMFDGSTQTFEAIKRNGSVSVLAVSNNKIIVNLEEQPNKPAFLAFPGGKMDKGEIPLDSAKRELLEETGYESVEWSELLTVDGSNLAKLEWMVHIFIAKQCIKNKDPSLDPGEKIETKLFTLDELIEERKQFGNRAIGLVDLLEKASQSREEKQKLQALLGIN